LENYIVNTFRLEVYWEQEIKKGYNFQNKSQ
jgi:hypothetical protein